MKFLLTSFIFLITPLLFCVFLIYAVLPLLVQRFFPPKQVSCTVEYPYQTSWEEVA